MIILEDKEKKKGEMMSKKLEKHVYSHSMVAASTTLAFIILSLGFPSASAYSSESIQPRVFVGRSLLQAVQECPVDVQNWNYTILTSKCKGPPYPPNICCEAFKDLACPYASYLNNATNNCASTMFRYIHLYGNYPRGLFANNCRDSPRGLECTSGNTTTGATDVPQTPSS